MEDRLNYIAIYFIVSSEKENLKFSYGNNLGSFMPSLQNYYRVGKSNTYILSILNPYIMYKDYYTSDDIMDFYVSFKTKNNAKILLLLLILVSIQLIKEF